MKITSARFLTGAVTPAQYPDHPVPEFAFFGKSNTGKSSLINMLTGRHGLVKTGAKPGMTQQVNFFLINEAFCLTDLPGVGYSYLPGAVRRALLPMISQYCVSRENLRAIFYLLDLRREIGDEELDTIAQLGARGVPVLLVGTKEDKLGRNDLIKTVRRWSEFFGLSEENLFITSSSKKVGRDKLLSRIASLV